MMNEEGNRFNYVGCCDLRTWTIYLSIFDIIALLINLILNIMHYDLCPWGAEVGGIISIIFLGFTIGLLFAVFKDHIAFIRIWLWVCVIWIVTSSFLTVYLSKLIFEMKVLTIIDGKEIQKIFDENLIALILFGLIIIVLKSVFHYPVYAYYIYKKAHRNNPNQVP